MIDLLGAYNSGNSSLEKQYLIYLNKSFFVTSVPPSINAINKNYVHK